MDTKQKKLYPISMHVSEEVRRYMSALAKRATAMLSPRARKEKARGAAAARWEDKPPLLCPVCGTPHQSIRALAAHRRKVKACKAKRGRPKISKQILTFKTVGW